MLKFYVKVFYVMGKVLSGELSCPCVRSCCALSFFKFDSFAQILYLLHNLKNKLIITVVQANGSIK